jgi:hypothetical protein
VTEPGLTLEQLSAATGIAAEALEDNGLRDDRHLGFDAVRVSYLAEDGETELAARYLTGVEPILADRARWSADAEPVLYGLPALGAARAEGAVVVTTGELDAIALALQGIPALGLPCPEVWDEDWLDHFEDIGRIDVVVARDRSGGPTLPSWLREPALRERVHLVAIPRASVVELHRSDTDGFAQAWASAAADATPWRVAFAEHCWSRCPDIAQASDVLALLDRDLKGRGFAGDTGIPRLLYLDITSRVLPKPASTVVKGDAAAGKNHTLEAALEYFPPSAYMVRTDMSDKALYYSKESFKHRTIVLFEAQRLKAGKLAELIRTLLSEGRLVYEFTDFEAKTTRTIDKEGPTNLMSTTTLVSLDPEVETRIWCPTVSDDPEQTRAIMLAHAEEDERTDPLRLDASWHAFQEAIAASPCQVSIPYARPLAELVDPAAVRMRRDFLALLTRIRSHAIVHQRTRSRDERGRIVADLTDYAAVYRLVAHLLTEVVQRAVPETVRETVDAVWSLAQQGRSGEGITVNELAEELGLHRSSVWRRVKEALSLGYLEDVSGDRRGRLMRVTTGTPMPEDRQLLPPPEKLEKALVDRDELARATTSLGPEL